MLSPSDVVGIVVAIKSIVDTKKDNDKTCKSMYKICEGNV